MTNPFGIGLAVAATASLAFAGGPDEKNGDKSLLDNLFQGTKVTYSPGKGITFDGGDEYQIKLGGRIQPQWYFLNLDNARDLHSFALRRARTKISGHLWSKDIKFYLQNEHTGSTSILDAWAAWRFYSGDEADLYVRFGLGKFHGSRQHDNSSGKLELAERSTATNAFSNERALGVALEGSSMQADDGTNMLHYFIGAVNNDLADNASNGQESINEHNEINFIGGARFDPQGDMGGLSFSEGDLDHSGNFQSSVAAMIQIGNDAVGGTEYENNQININGAIKTGNGVAAQGEIWIRSDDQDGGGEQDSIGWYVQGSYTTAPASTQWGFAGRIAMIDIDSPDGAPFTPLMSAEPLAAGQGDPLGGLTGDVLEITGGVSAYYHKHYLKTQVNYTYQDANPDGAAVDAQNHLLQVLFTLTF